MGKEENLNNNQLFFHIFISEFLHLLNHYQFERIKCFGIVPQIIVIHDRNLLLIIISEKSTLFNRVFELTCQPLTLSPIDAC